MEESSVHRFIHPSVHLPSIHPILIRYVSVINDTPQSLIHSFSVNSLRELIDSLHCPGTRSSSAYSFAQGAWRSDNCSRFQPGCTTP